jgi:hypothetical protein
MEVIPLGVASPRTYECFVCKRNGIDGIQVYLDGKDAEGRTRYLNENRSMHIHQHAGTVGVQPMIAQQGSEEQVVSLLKMINAKLDLLINKTSDSSAIDE